MLSLLRESEERGKRQSFLPFGLVLSRIVEGSKLVRMHKHEQRVENGVFCLDFSPCGRILVACMESNVVRLLDPLQGRNNSMMCVGALEAHTGPVNHFNYMSEHVIITASDDCTVKEFDVRRLSSSSLSRQRDADARNIDLMCSNAVGCPPRRSLHIQETAHSQPRQRCDLSQSSNGLRIGSGSSLSAGRSLDTMQGIGSALVNSYEGHREWVKNVEPIDRRRFLSSSLHGNVRVWDAVNDGASVHRDYALGTRSNVILSHRGLTRMALCEDFDEKRLVVSFTDGSVVILHKLKVPMQSCLDATASSTQIVSKSSLHTLLKLSKYYDYWVSGWTDPAENADHVPRYRFRRRPKDYYQIPDECYQEHNRMELLHEPLEGCTSSLKVSRHETRPLLLSRRTTDEPWDQLCVYRLDSRLPAGYHRRRAVLEGLETTHYSGAKRKRTAPKIASASEALRLFPPRLLASCYDSPTSEFFLDASMSPCGRLICSPYHESFRVMDASRICKQDYLDQDQTGPSARTDLNVLYTGQRSGRSDGYGTAVLTTAFHPHLLACANGALDGTIWMEVF